MLASLHVCTAPLLFTMISTGASIPRCCVEHPSGSFPETLSSCAPATVALHSRTPISDFVSHGLDTAQGDAGKKQAAPGTPVSPVAAAMPRWSKKFSRHTSSAPTTPNGKYAPGPDGALPIGQGLAAASLLGQPPEPPPPPPPQPPRLYAQVCSPTCSHLLRKW